MSLGARIKKRRLHLELTQGELSKKSGVPLTSVRNYEKDMHEPSLFNITCIADALGVSLDYLAGRTDKKFVNK